MINIHWNHWKILFVNSDEEYENSNLKKWTIEILQKLKHNL